MAPGCRLLPHPSTWTLLACGETLLRRVQDPESPCENKQNLSASQVKQSAGAAASSPRSSPTQELVLCVFKHKQSLPWTDRTVFPISHYKQGRNRQLCTFISVKSRDYFHRIHSRSKIATLKVFTWKILDMSSNLIPGGHSSYPPPPSGFCRV